MHFLIASPQSHGFQTITRFQKQRQYPLLQEDELQNIVQTVGDVLFVSLFKVGSLVLTSFVMMQQYWFLRLGHDIRKSIDFFLLLASQEF